MSTAGSITDTPAHIGYTEAMKLMAAGRLSSVVLWRADAFDRYREAVLFSAPNHEWMERFNKDLKANIGVHYSASFIVPEDEDYPTEHLANEEGPVAVIKLTKDVGNGHEKTSRVIVRPEAEQVLSVIMAYRWL